MSSLFLNSDLSIKGGGQISVIHWKNETKNLPKVLQVANFQSYLQNC